MEFACSTNNLEQYDRKSNIIISSIPDSIDVNQLEESFNKILTDINVYVASNDIEACHRISKKDTRIGIIKTNIRFVNRKHVKQALYNKNKVLQLKKNTHLTLKIISFLLTRI